MSARCHEGDTETAASWFASFLRHVNNRAGVCEQIVSGSLSTTMTRRIAHKLETQWRSQDVLQSEDENATFEEFLLSKQLLSGLRKSGFVRPSPIQLRAIPLGLCGFDMVVQAKSGTGKTCVFSVLTLQAVNVSKNAVQVLILAPTREIAVQSCDTVCCLGCDMPELRAYAFIGGMPIKEDLQKLARCHVAVGTLGRLLQLIQQGQLSLEWVRLLVLDEADQLLGEGFQEDLRKLWALLPKRRQVVATSATYPSEVARILEEELLRNPMVVRLGADTPALLGVSQWYCVAEGSHEAAWFSKKLRTLDKLLRRMPFSQCLVFLNSQARAQSLEERLRHAGHRVQLLSGAQAQSERIKALVCLKAYRCRILVSTDLAARGIDAERVNLVIHFDVAYDLETHLHRSGRAGRYGTAGQAVTLVAGLQELEQLRTLCAPLNLDIKPLPGSSSCECESNNVQLNGDASSDVAEKEMTEAAVHEPSSEVAPCQENSYNDAGSYFTQQSPQKKVTCAQLVQMPKNTFGSSSTNSSEEICVKEMSMSVSAVSPPPAEGGSMRPDIPAVELSTVESTPESDSKEAHAKVVQSLRSTPELTQTESTGGATKSVLQLVMDPSRKLKEILMSQKVPARVQPLLEWPPDLSICKELAARIQEEKEAFCKAYGVVFEPGRTLKIAPALRVTEQSCASPSMDDVIPSHDKCEADDTKTVVRFSAGTDGSCIKEKQKPRHISPEAVDVKKIVSSHEKQEADEASHMLHSDKAVYEKTNEGQQELSVQASVPQDTNRAEGDTSTRDKFPQTSFSGHRECKLKERCGSLKKDPVKSGIAAEATEIGCYVVHNSEHRHSSLELKPSARIEGRTLQCRRPQPRSLDISRELKKTMSEAPLKENDTVVNCERKQRKGASFGGGSDEDNSVLHFGRLRSSTRSRELTSLTHPARINRTYLSPLTRLDTPAVRDRSSTDNRHPIETSLCYECAQKCDVIRATCFRERHLLRTPTVASSSVMAQFQVSAAATDWSRNWFMWHQWYIKRMLQANRF